MEFIWLSDWSLFDIMDIVIQGCPLIDSHSRTLILLTGVSSKMAYVDLRFKYGLYDSPVKVRVIS